MLAALIAVFAVIADQLSKYFVVNGMELFEEKSFIPSVMSFYRTENTGAAFSMLSDSRWVFMTLSAVAMGVIVWLLIRENKRHPLLTVSLAMILGGGTGNMIDRLRLGYVVDFLRFDFVDFAVFNIADSFITVGAVLLAVYVLFFESRVEKRLASEKAEKLAAETRVPADDEKKEAK